jgi:hypothetical protein
MAKTKKEKLKTASLTVPITIEEPQSLFFREAWAEGKHGDEKFEFTRNANAAAIHFAIGPEKGFPQTYTLTVDDLVRAFISMHEDLKAEKTVKA